MSAKYNIDFIKSNRTFQNRLDIKSAGPPRPFLNLKQECKTKNKTFTRIFKSEMYNKKKWLCGCERLNALFCFPCVVFGGEAIWTETGVKDLTHLGEKIKKHDSSQVHLQNVLSMSVLGTVDIRNQLDSVYRANIQKYNEQVDKNRYILSRLIDCVKFCGAFELALRGHDETSESLNAGVFRGLVDFVSELDGVMKEHLSASSVFKGTSKTIQNDILDSILAVYHSELSQKIKQCDYVAIQADETTDVSTVMQMVFLIRYEDNGHIHERFWKYLTPQSHSADGLSSAILTELQDLQITAEQLIAQCYDGASVMSGNVGGVQAKIKSLYPGAQFVHCYAHQLNLIIEKSVCQNKTVQKFFANLQAFPKFFSRSTKRTEVLKKIVSKRIPAAPQTRWNFNSRTVNSVYTYKDALKECMTCIIETENDNNSINQADMLLRYLNDTTFLYWLDFFQSILPQSEILFKQMQKRNIDLVTIKNNIQNFEKSIQNARNCIDQTEEPAQPASRRAIPTSSSTAKEVCDVIITQVKDRFQFSNHLIAAKLFYCENFTAYRATFPEEDFKTTVSTYAFLEKNKLKNELCTIYNRDDFINANSAIAILQFIYNNDLLEPFSETTKLLKIICTIPMTSVESERCFSTLKRIKSFLRNTMTQDRLNALSVLSIEKKFIHSMPDFNKKVIEHFASNKERRIDLKYK